MTDTPSDSPTLEELPELRRKTELLSTTLKEQLSGHLETIQPLLSPQRLVGKYAGGKTEVVGAEKALSELEKNYKPFTSKPFDLPQKLDPHWLTLVGGKLVLHPWEYVHEVQGKAITMTSPVRWVLSYQGNYSFAQAARILGGQEAGRAEHLRQFVVNALTLQLVVDRNPGLVKLFRDLRYELAAQTSPDLKDLPLTTITSSLTSFRPADDLIHAATSFSGVPAFIEILNLQEIGDCKDPFKERIEAALK